MRSGPKPVRKCHRCPLNLGKTCGIFASPHHQWEKGRCPGFMNEELLKRYLEDLARHPLDESKVARQMRALQTRSTPHWSGDRHVLLSAERPSAPAARATKQ